MQPLTDGQEPVCTGPLAAVVQPLSLDDRAQSVATLRTWLAASNDAQGTSSFAPFPTIRAAPAPFPVPSTWPHARPQLVSKNPFGP
jgi:hypothetical protein